MLTKTNALSLCLTTALLSACVPAPTPPTPKINPTWYADTDVDTFGNINITLKSSVKPDGYVSNSLDCDDSNPNINPDATEVYDSADNNCDGVIDEGFVASNYYQDLDGDGRGNPNVFVSAISKPVGYVVDNTDCNDNSYSPTNNCKNYVFVTSGKTGGYLNGFNGADDYCQSFANSSTFLPAGVYKAWLSTSTVNATSRLTHSTQPYYRTNNVKIANNWSELASATIEQAVYHNENGVAIVAPAYAWTSTTRQGTSTGVNYAAGSCNDWMSSASEGIYGYVGKVQSTNVSGQWSAYQARNCNESHHLYCVKQ
jgi:hypothetical protein